MKNVVLTEDVERFVKARYQEGFTKYASAQSGDGKIVIDVCFHPERNLIATLEVYPNIPFPVEDVYNIPGFEKYKKQNKIKIGNITIKENIENILPKDEDLL